jgi:hypothetical protein
MRNVFSRLGFALGYSAVAILLLAGLAVAQGVSSGGAFMPRADIVVSGSWLFKHATAPIKLEGSTDDDYETTIAAADPTADRTFTLPDASSDTFTLNGAANAFTGANTFSGVNTVTGRWFVRDDFDQGYFIHQDDMTAKSVTDAEVNIVYGSPLGVISYREELTKTTSSWVIADGKLDIAADNTTTLEGVEIVFGGVGTNTTEGVIVAGTSGACLTVNLTLTDISGTDQLLIGWRDNATFTDVANYAGYTVWNVVGVNAADGSIVSLQEVSEATDSDDSGVNMADGQTRTFKSCVSAAGVPTAYYTAASGTTFTAITMTETGSTLTAGTQLYPFLSYRAVGTDGPNPLINWVQLEAAP